MTARLVRGGIGFTALGGAMALALASPAAAADTGVPVLERIKQCESGGDYTAENPYSTASGAYQFIDSTFQSLSASEGYTHASDAPESVQDAAAIELYNEQGTTPWVSTASCWGSEDAVAESDTSSDDMADSDWTEQSTGSTYHTHAGVPAPQSPVEQTPVEDAPVENVPAEQAPVEQTPVEEAPVEAPIEGSPEAPVDEAPVEQTPVEEAPVEEAPAEGTPVEEAPVGEATEAPVEEVPVEEVPVDETA